MGLSPAALRAAVERAAAAMPGLEQGLNAADSKLGDGDTGGMLARLVGGLAKAPVPAEADLGATFSAYARAAATATGSSLGTLFATALLTMSKATKGKESVAWSELSPLLESAREAMMARGGAKLGDKTVLDALDAVATAVRGLDNPAAIGAAATAAADGALARFRDQPNKIGRARMFADASIGLDDPGMLAFARLTKVLAGAPQG
jgi:dihydroxyacetone kinase